MPDKEDLKEFEVIVETKLVSYDKLKIRAKNKEDVINALKTLNETDKKFKCRHDYGRCFKELGLEAYFYSSWSDNDILSIKYNNSDIKEKEPVNMDFSIELRDDEKTILIKNNTKEENI